MASARSRSRNLCKSLPKEGLFLFECDNKTDVRPTNSVINPPNEIIEGNTVTVVYGMETLKAKIIKLSGQDNILYASFCNRITNNFFDGSI